MLTDTDRPPQVTIQSGKDRHNRTVFWATVVLPNGRLVKFRPVESMSMLDDWIRDELDKWEKETCKSLTN